MNYSIKEMVLNDEEFSDLKWCVGEYQRICREQATSEYGNHKLTIANSLIGKLNEVEWLNKTIK